MRYPRPLVHRALKRLAIPVVALVAMQGCALYDDRCGAFTREISVTGSTATPALYAQFGLVDDRDTGERTFSWHVQGGALRPGLQALDLVDAQTGEVWAGLPIATSIPDVLASGVATNPGWTVSWDDVRARLANGRGRVRFTYAAPAPSVVLPLVLAHSYGYAQARCG